MKNYICIKTLQLECYDEDGFVIENKYSEVGEGEIFQRSEEKFRCVGGIDSIRLENDEQWLEISAETLKEHFEEIADRPNEKGGASNEEV